MSPELTDKAMTKKEMEKLLKEGFVSFAPPPSSAEIRQAELQKRLDGMKKRMVEAGATQTLPPELPAKEVEQTKP